MQINSTIQPYWHIFTRFIEVQVGVYFLGVTVSMLPQPMRRVAISCEDDKAVTTWWSRQRSKIESNASVFLKCPVSSASYMVAPKIWLTFCTHCHNYWPIFNNFFTVRIRRKLVILLSLKITPHLKCVATLALHCEISVS